MSWVKICGISKVEDVHAVAEVGGDAIGLLHIKTPDASQRVGSDRLTLPQLKQLRDVATENGLEVVLLLHTTDESFLVRLLDNVRPFALQLQVHLPIDVLKNVRLRYPDLCIVRTIKNLGVYDALFEEAQSCDEAEHIDRILVDSARPGGGTQHDWGTCRLLVESRVRKPIILAGGLNVENVASAIQTVKPWGVDVMSGVRNPDRTLSVSLVKQFVACAQSGFTGPMTREG